MIKVDWVGFESRLAFGHKLGVEVEDVDGLQVPQASKLVRISYVELGR